MNRRSLHAKFSLVLLVLILSIHFSQPQIFSFTSASNNQNRWWENWCRDRNHNKIDDLIEQRIQGHPLSSLSVPAENYSFSVFIHYDNHPDENDLQILRNMHLQISYVAKYINVICVRNVSIQAIYSLASLPRIVMIELQPQIFPRLDVSARAIKARDSVIYSPRTAWELGYTGENIVVAVLDTGVDDEHEFLRGKFVAGFDCSGPTAITDRETNPDDIDGHGTHVASIIMGSGGAAEIYKGVAPDAKLVDVKVLSERGYNLGDQLIRGIEWVISNKEKYGIKVINLSVGSDIEDPDGTSAISQAANSAVENGLVVVAAAGNEGPTSQSLTAPSVADKVVCVTALDDMNTVNRADDVIAVYSSRGPRGDGAQKPDVCAPGSDIIGARFAKTGKATDEIVSMSGTSMAAPHVAGLAALILEANPNLSPLQVKEIILKTAEDKGIEGWDPEYGWGEIDAYNAVLEALNFGQTNQPPRIVSAISNVSEVHRVIESFALEATIIDDRTPSENLTVKMLVNNPAGEVIEIEMVYDNLADLWIGTFTPNATAHLGNYSARIWAFDGEGGESESEPFYFTVLNNPPSIISFKIKPKVVKGESLLAIVKAFDYEGLANASICLRNDGQWLNFTRSFNGDACIFEIDTSNFREGAWEVLVAVQDVDGAITLSSYGKIMISFAIPVLAFTLIALMGATVVTFLAFIILKRVRGN